MSDIDAVCEMDAASRAALFEGIVASAMDAIVAVDDCFRIIAINPAAEAMFGIEAAAISGQSLEQFIPVRFHAAHREHVDRFIGTGEAHRSMGARGLVTAQRADGEEFSVEATLSRTWTDLGWAAAIIMREADKSDEQAASALLARELDHRAKNILAVVSSLIALTKAPTQADYAAALSRRVAALARANALLSAERWTGASLTRLVEGEVEAETEGTGFRVEGPDLNLSARAIQPIGLLLHELASNASRHGALGTPAGRLTIGWSEAPDGGLAFVWREEGGAAVTVPAQTGLGLRLIQQIVEGQLGGRCTCDWSTDGLTFEAHLPATTLEHRQTDRKASATAPRQTGAAPLQDEATRADPQDELRGTLLIVEDEPILAMQLTRALGGFGWTVLGVAGSVEAANRLLAEHPKPDVAILDVDLGGEPVFPFARALRTAGIPFMFCTGFEDVAYIQEFTDCIVVRKPATALQIVSALRRTVQQRNLSQD